ncbi:DUF1156 domain-containing protein [Parvularcula lutaonensis]|uniref:DUF1156 domain-containing protein n=1 Tax=Parvularcula lutaonensis TaxID=491923 RepID=A0ABV7MBC3_9PROT|nr:DUF1156 domain-containing protein [Parvularcula lutaonensis]GGY37132.1 hypothetical protein GCM10007148_01660 [Parvularcula lutaonensis]
MTPTPYKKKLIEVAIPLEAINAASAREKSIRHGHPSTLHLWWARRPLAACRAVLFAQLVDDPSSHPDKFPTPEDQEAERKRLFKIIEDLVKWENSTNEEVLERARAEIRKSCGDELPPVYDPFSGGGSIPLEAQRLGLPAYGSDLNPVAVMIGKAMIEIPPKFKDQPPIHPGPKARTHYRNAEGLAEDVKYYGEWMRERAFERIGHLYPQVDLPKEYGGGKATVIATIWARSVPSPDPAFSDVHVPIASSFLLSSKKGKEVWIETVVNKQAKTISYRIRHGGTKAEIAAAKDGSKAGRGANFRCLFSGAAITPEHVRNAANTGTLSQSLIAIVAEGTRGRVYLDPTSEQESAAFAEPPQERHDIRFEPKALGFRIGNYGMTTFGDLFTDRQTIALNTFSDLVFEAHQEVERDALSKGFDGDQKSLADGGKGAPAYADAVSVYLAFAVGRSANTLCTLARWTPDRQQTVTVFSRQALPMTWDYPDVNPFSGAAGDYTTSISGVTKGLFGLGAGEFGLVKQADAQTVEYPPQVVISTDPPYYDNIGYADLSDFFFHWMRRGLKHQFPDLFGLLAVPKNEELVATPVRHGGPEAAHDFFLNGMRQVVGNMARQSSDDIPATIYYAFKQSEIDQEGISSTGWATFLDAVVAAGYQVVGTWPMRTELANRMRGIGANALANSVVLVCRKKEASAEVITRAEFIRALKRELPPAIAELQAANIAPADMPQSAIGPGMGVFSRYAAVLESDDTHMSVKTALQLINKELQEYLEGVVGDLDDETRFAITWYEQHGLKPGDYGVADNLARARGISVEAVKHAGIVESAAGKVRILRRDELDADWAPETDKHLTIWEMLQYLIRLHEASGLSEDAAALLKRYGAQADAVKDLAYCLYDIAANKRREASEATAYNALIADWTELSRMAASVSLEDANRQLFFDV